jgi:TonB family protein
MKRSLLLLFLVAAPAFAADPFIERLAGSEVALKKGDYAKALKIDEELIQGMVDHLGPGSEETKWFAVAVLHKALALAGLGQKDEAIWTWHAAVNIYPDIAASDMSMFGAPAAFLKEHPLVEEPELPHVNGKSVQAPVVLERVEAVYPYAVRVYHVTGIVILQCIIDKSGNVRDIVIKKRLPAGTLTYAAMEAIRKWKFQPATMDGRPVDVVFNLTFNFKLR